LAGKIKNRIQLKYQKIMNIKYKAEYASEVMETIPYGYIDKTICGCGLTTVALENSENIIIAVPTIGLMNNKVEQYPNTRCKYNILGVWGETEINGQIKEGTSGNEIIDYINNNSPIKIMVTYNSLRKVEFLLKSCRLIIDESDNLLSSTKSFSKEIAYLFDICNKYKDTVSFISATPTPLNYMPTWVKDIPQVKIEWEDTTIATPILLKRTYPYKALREEIVAPLQKQPITIGGKTFSKVIIFINSIEQIVNTIKESNIDKKECAIICGDNLKNDIKISGIDRYTIHKKFPKYLFITKSGFSGIDLNSEEAMTVVVSNTSKKWQMVDMLTDLKQAVSRQRLKTNPNYGSYIYIYNQTIFSKPEDELLSELESVKKKIILNIPHYKYLSSIGEESSFMKDADFNAYTLFKNEEYYLNEQAFQADLYFILEIRKQYTQGFQIKSGINVDKEVSPITIKDVSYSDLVDYYNLNKENLDWSLIGGKEEWKEVITKSYELYKTTWKNYTYAKQMIKSFGNSFDIIKTDLVDLLKKGTKYTTQEIKDILSTIYIKYALKRTPKISDLNDIVKTKQIRINNKRFIEII